MRETGVGSIWSRSLPADLLRDAEAHRASHCGLLAFLIVALNPLHIFYSASP